MSLYTILAIVLAVLLWAFSAAQLAFAAYMINYSMDHSRSGHQYFSYAVPVQSYNFSWLPPVNVVRSYALQLTTGVLGVIFGAAVFGFAVCKTPYTIVGTGKRPPRSITWPIVAIILSSILLSLSLSSMVVSFYDNTHYGTGSLINMSLCTAQGASGVLRTGCSNNLATAQVFFPFTMEGWTCRMSWQWFRYARTIGSEADDIIPRTCRIAFFSRWWTFPLLFLPLFVLIVALLEMRRKNIARFHARQEQAAGLHPRNQSFGSAETAIPFSPNGTLPQYTAHGELGGNGKSEVGGKQIMEAPEKTPYDEMPAETHQVYSELSAAKSKDAIAV